MTHTTLLLILDGGRADYVRPETMPFLSGLAAAGPSGELESPPGSAQRSVLFTGRYPDTSGRFGAFRFDPDGSPFRWVRGLGPLKALAGPRPGLASARAAVRAITKWTARTSQADPAWIPPRYLPYFRPCEAELPVHAPHALGAASLFDQCRAHGRSFRYLAPPLDGRETDFHGALVRRLRAGDRCDLYVTQLSDPDRQGHDHGPASAQMREHLRGLDDRLAQVHAALGSGHDAWDLVVAGDHGMAPVRQRADVLAAVERIDARPGKDYVAFVHSTLASFWYLTDRGRREVEAVLPSIQGCRLVSAGERLRHRIPLDRAWGDRIVAALPGVLLWPNYTHGRSQPPRGMHGYLDKAEEGHGALLLASSRPLPRRDLGVRPLADVLPTLCGLLGLPVPPTSEGRALLPNDSARPEPLAAPLAA